MATVRRCAVGVAPMSVIVAVLNSMTCGWSISYTTVPSGQGNRYGLESRPEARMTACRIPASVAAVPDVAAAVAAVSDVATAVAPMKKSSKNLVRTAITESISPAVAAFSSESGISPSTRRVKNSTPTARTSGAANGSTISGLGSLLASARDAATIVAVAPTLEARSQLSESVRLTGRRPTPR